MYKFITVVAVISLLSGAFSAVSADLVLKDGKIYKSYRVKSVQNNKVVVAYIAQDGTPDVAEINIADLPDDIAKSLGSNQQSAQAANPAEQAVALISARLKTDLAALNANDTSARQALLDQASELLKKELAPYFSDAEFETVWNSTDGVIAKVVKVNSSTALKENEKIFIRSASQLSSRFRALVYATGCVMQFGTNEILPVFAFDESAAASFALKSILTAIGDKSPAAVSANTVAATANATATANTAANATEAPVQLYPQYQPMEPVQPVVNNYYIYNEDDEDDEKKVIVERRRRKKYPVYVGGYVPVVRPTPPGGHRPPPHVRPERPRPGSTVGEPNRPHPRPGSTVGEPNRRPRPGRPGGNMSGSNSGRPPRFKRNKSTVQRSKNAIHSYDHLPSWAHPRYSRNQ